MLGEVTKHLAEGANMTRCTNIVRTVLTPVCCAVLCLALFGCGGSAPATNAPDAPDASDTQPHEAGPQEASSIDIEQVHVPFGTIMASDGEYLYFAFRDHDDVGGLYRAKLPVEQAEMLDRGMFSDLYLSDGALYYVEGAGLTSDGSSISYHRMDTHSLDKSDITEDDFEAVCDAVDPGRRSGAPSDAKDVAVVGDCTYFMEYLDEIVKQDDGVVPVYEMALSRADDSGKVTQVATWAHQSMMGSVVNAYGDYVIYSRPWESDPELSEKDVEAYRFDDMPCIYDTKTGAETLLIRKRSIQTDVYAIGATSGYLLVTTTDDELADGSYMNLESLADQNVQINMDDLVESATPASAFEEREASEQAAAEEALRNEPYGPGTSKLVLSASEKKSTAFRLVRMDGSTEFMVLLGPGEESTQSFPSGRYTLKVAEGDAWISDEEAFGPDGDYSSTDVYTFEAGSSYKISSGSKGDFHNDDASGFAG